MNDLIHSIEKEFERLNAEFTLTENQFFVILSDRDIKNHEEDVGLTPDTSANIDTRRGRVLSKLRGTGTVTKTMMKNVSKSFVNGDIKIIEYSSKYCFAVKFTSKTGVPYNLDDIKAMIDEIKSAHLAVEYIFTYRLWQDISDEIQIWTTAKNYSWEWLLTFEVKSNLNISEVSVFYCPDGSGNGKIIWNSNKAYARRNNG